MNPKVLGSSFETAKRRFLSLERRIASDQYLHDMYMEFMKEYLNLGHMSLLPGTPPGHHYYIPHQCVLRPDSSTTKLRVVFDASCKTSTSISLNETLMVGATIQRELFATLARFRLNRFALTADISKMYRQVQVAEEDRNFQLILWREKANIDVQTYRLNTVTYGTASAPFLAIRCLVELAKVYAKSHPVASQVIANDFYVDDMLTGANSLEELGRIRQEVSEVLEAVGFMLANWASNHPHLLSDSGQEKSLQFDPSASIKTLGIRWNPQTDLFHYQLDDSFDSLPPTKRNILAKILLQHLWRQKLDWDESVPMSLHTSWNRFKQNLFDLDKISIPRFIGLANNSTIQIHGFADASAKSRVSPLKTKSIPRLELCAALLLSTLWSQVRLLLDTFVIESVNFWSDSQVTLYWLERDPATLTTFVANRVAEIQELSSGVIWRHVPTDQNPADLVSRGTDVDGVMCSLWTNGPHFLLSGPENWPLHHQVELSPEMEKSEDKKSVAAHSVAKGQTNEVIELIGRCSSFQKLLRIMAYVNRFIQGGNRSRDVVVSAKELKVSFLRLVQVVQRCELGSEFLKLDRSEILSPHLQRLSPFIHTSELGGVTFRLIRVGGRLLHAEIPYDAKFPLLLSQKSQFAILFLRHLHRAHYHAGAKVMVSLLRQQIWLLNAREACTRIVRNCVHCFRYKPILMGQIMGNLPADRVRRARPFLICGVDFCGPFQVSLKIRGRPPIKTYVAVFVCFASKAVHLELVVDLSTDSFLCVFQKVRREERPSGEGLQRQRHQLRGREPSNGRASRSISEGSGSAQDVRSTARRRVVFHTTESTALRRALGSGSQGSQTAADTRSWQRQAHRGRAQHPPGRGRGHPQLPANRFASNDPSDGEALTPGHLLIGQPLLSLPSESEQDANCIKGGFEYLKRWRMLSALKQQFWQGWSKDYLASLQQRQQWSTEGPNLEAGCLVLVHEDNTPPQKWTTGRVVATTAGEDGRVRVAEVRTSAGVIKRAVQKLAKLPMDG
ncbi:uncharacterized protein LOC121404266 [Drosophila obscura]|uniref:uncharacterized protein LOC121404266 n=1 Tax=Drosophila obscura TaxID=7282 RepID=UPI001BB0E3B5|nr:uncharacterized protein LOC121404266 [Drosophila obscura]